MLDFIIVYSIIMGIRYLLIYNRPMEKLDAGDIAFLNKQRKKKHRELSMEELKKTLKGRGIGLLVLAGIAVFFYFIVFAAMMGSMMQ